VRGKKAKRNARSDEIAAVKEKTQSAERIAHGVEKRKVLQCCGKKTAGCMALREKRMTEKAGEGLGKFFKFLCALGGLCGNI